MGGEPLASYDDALDFLSAFTNYEKLPPGKPWAAKLGLERVNDLLAAVGNPHRDLRCVHVAGTKGKGSTATMVERILRRTGAKVGLFTSPHVESELERIQIDGRWISREQALQHFRRMHSYLLSAKDTPEAYRPSFFEIFTAMAFLHFQQERVDWAVVEVGLGGRLDATNVVAPQVCAITPVDIDHTNRLGNTLGLIAGEKAGIIKPGVPVVVAAQKPEALAVILDKAEKLAAPVHRVGDDISVSTAADGTFTVSTWRRTCTGLRCAMLGDHQRRNAATAIGVIETLNDLGLCAADDIAIRTGIAEAVLLGRVEVLAERPAVVVDVAHNTASVEALLRTIEAHLPHRRMILVFGCACDKDAAAMLHLLAPKADRVILAPITNPRAMPMHELEPAARAAGCRGLSTAPAIDAAIEQAVAEAAADDLICAAGSFYLVGDARRAWARLAAERQPRAASA